MSHVGTTVGDCTHGKLSLYSKKNTHWIALTDLTTVFHGGTRYCLHWNLLVCCPDIVWRSPMPFTYLPQHIWTWLGGHWLIYTQSMMDDLMQVQHTSSINLMWTSDADTTLRGFLQGGSHVDNVLITTVWSCPCSWAGFVLSFGGSVFEFYPLADLQSCLHQEGFYMTINGEDSIMTLGKPYISQTVTPTHSKTNCSMSLEKK